MTVDSHTHAWGPPSVAHPWVNAAIVEDIGTYAVDPIFTAETLLDRMDAVGIDEAVVVGYPVCEWTDNWYTRRAAASHDRLSGVVMIDPFAADAASRLEAAMQVDGVLGVRLGGLCPYDRMWETFDTAADWLRAAIDEPSFWRVAIEEDALIQLLVHVSQLDQALALVETYPELTYLFDHFGYDAPEPGPDDSDFQQFEALAEYDTVGVKVSEIVHQSEQDFPYADMHAHVRWLVETFGRERVVWGSDFPNVSDEAQYEQTLAWLDHVDELSAVDRQWLTGRSFRTHVGIE